MPGIGPNGPRDEGATPFRIARKERYCLARMQGMSPYEAEIESGYSAHVARQHKRERQEDIQSRLQYLRKQVADKVVTSAAVTKHEIIESVRETRRMAKRGKPMLSKDGKPTGEMTKPDLSSANRSDELLAKMHGFMEIAHEGEDLDSELDGKSPEELKAVLLSMLEMVDPNMRKQILREVEAADEEDLADDRVMN